jgi:hypothetical protein
MQIGLLGLDGHGGGPGEGLGSLFELPLRAKREPRLRCARSNCGSRSMARRRWECRHRPHPAAPAVVRSCCARRRNRDTGAALPRSGARPPRGVPGGRSGCRGCSARPRTAGRRRSLRGPWRSPRRDEHEIEQDDPCAVLSGALRGPHGPQAPIREALSASDRRSDSMSFAPKPSTT